MDFKDIPIVVSEKIPNNEVHIVEFVLNDNVYYKVDGKLVMLPKARVHTFVNIGENHGN